jgi:hypothetical protein
MSLVSTSPVRALLSPHSQRLISILRVLDATNPMRSFKNPSAHTLDPSRAKPIP